MKSIGLVPELYCSNIEKTLSFYVGTLGFKILYQRLEEKFAYLQKGNAEMMFEEIGLGRNWITETIEHPYGRGINFQIEVENVDELYNSIKENSIEIFMPIEDKWYQKDDMRVGNRQFIVQDPDGYLLRFYQDLGENLE